MFNDVPASSPFCRWIEELFRRGVVSGCGGGNYCPSQPVTREQMSVFVLRTLDQTLNPPACVPPNDFNDVPETSPFCRWIEELFRRGVVSGCGGGNYCPTDPVAREQMFWETVNRPRSFDYPYTVVEMRLDANGKGQGKMTVATKVNAFGDVIELENYDLTPVQLSNIRASKK